MVLSTQVLRPLNGAKIPKFTGDIKRFCVLSHIFLQFTEQQQDKLNKVQLDDSWKTSLSDFLLSQKMDNLREFLQQEILAQKTIYPPSKQIFNAFNTTPLNNVKVVILGQDPYHGPGQAGIKLACMLACAHLHNCSLSYFCPKFIENY